MAGFSKNLRPNQERNGKTYLQKNSIVVVNKHEEDDSTDSIGNAGWVAPSCCWVPSKLVNLCLGGSW